MLQYCLYWMQFPVRFSLSSLHWWSMAARLRSWRGRDIHQKWGNIPPSVSSLFASKPYTCTIVNKLTHYHWMFVWKVHTLFLQGGLSCSCVSSSSKEQEQGGYTEASVPEHPWRGRQLCHVFIYTPVFVLCVFMWPHVPIQCSACVRDDYNQLNRTCSQ